MTILNCMAAVLAVWEIVEIWHHSRLLSCWRAVVECHDGRIAQALRCPFCLTPWLSLFIVIWLDISQTLGSRHPAAGLILAAPVYAFAVARGANLGNDLGRGVCRTPRDPRSPPASGEAGGGSDYASLSASFDDLGEESSKHG